MRIILGILLFLLAGCSAQPVYIEVPVTTAPLPTATLDLSCDLQLYIERLQREYTDPPLQGEPIKLDDGFCWYNHSPEEGAELMDSVPSPQTCGTGTCHLEWQQ